MHGLTMRVVQQDIKKLETEALVVGFHENVRPLKNLAGEVDWLLCGSLSGLIINRKLQGRCGEAALLTSRGKIPARKIFLVGLGSADDQSPAAQTERSATVVEAVLKAGVRQAAFECFSAPGIPLATGVPAFCSGVSKALRGRDLDIIILAPSGAAPDTISQLVTACAGGSPTI